MDIVLFCIVLALALIFITLGLFVPEHTELSLIGFVFLFLLALCILNNQITYKIGTETNSTFGYTPSYNSTNFTLLTSSNEVVTDIYGPITLGGPLSHVVGYWLMIASFVGFLLVIISIRASLKQGDN
jgi:hypothetical protein